MGICCDTNNVEDNTVRDLPAPDVSTITDQYVRFEKQLPFARITLKAFDEACKEDGKYKETITLEELAAKLTTPAWKDLAKPDSALAKILTSDVFAEEGAIRVPDLLLFAILHCVSKKNELRARILYELLQDGGAAVHQQISAQDKDFMPTFKKLCALATTDLFATIAADEIENAYGDDTEALTDGDTLEGLGEDWLDVVYGDNSRLQYEAWVTMVAKEGSWLLDADALRTKVLEKVEVEKKH